MFESFGEMLLNYLYQLGGLGVLFGVLLETFIAPIPSPLVPMAAGFILIPSNVSIYEAIFTSLTIIASFGSIGATLGAYFGYALGLFGGRRILDRFGRYLGIDLEDVKKIEEMTKGYSREIVVLITRIIPIMPLSPVSFFAGIVKFNIIKFTFLTFLGCLPRYFVLGLVGWWTGIAYYGFVEKLGFLEDILLLLLVVGVIGYVVIRKMKKNKKFLNK